MQKLLDKTTQDFKAFGLMWKFYQAYYIPEDSDEFWEKFIKDGETMIKQFPDVMIVRAFVTAFQNVLENKLKSKKIVNCEMNI